MTNARKPGTRRERLRDAGSGSSLSDFGAGHALGLLGAGVASVVSVARVDCCFTEPLFAFFTSDSHDWVAFVTFEAAALLVRTLSQQVKFYAEQSMYVLMRGLRHLQDPVAGDILQDLDRAGGPPNLDHVCLGVGT